MSGTSLDGIDLAEVNFSLLNNRTWDYKILNTETVFYSKNWRASLKNALTYSETEVSKLNIQYTRFLAFVISRFIDKNQIKNLNAVCNHGHTIWHQPQKGITLQIGNLPELADLIKQNVVCDFRLQDVKLGGNGAPLVPIGDQLLFNDYDYCLNLGGFANISYEENIGFSLPKRIAYDICPVNIVLNYLAEKIGYEFDHNGDFAQSGKVSNKVLNELNKLSFFNFPPPKSLGLEWVKKYVFPILEESNISIIDQLCTYTEHIAFQLSKQFNKNSKVLVTGGGAFNLYLLKRINSFKHLKLLIPSNTLVEYKEALIFGFLGVLRLRGENNCLSSVTGAKKNHSSGTVFKIK